MMDNERLNVFSGKILDAAIEVHRNLEPGLLESVMKLAYVKNLI